MSVKKVSPQNGGFIRATEAEQNLLIDKNLSSSQRNLVDNFLLNWIITGNLLDNSL